MNPRLSLPLLALSVAAAATLVPLTPLDAAARPRALAAVSAIGLDGGTNIADGLRTGLAALAGAHARSRRLVLISDGEANVGPSTPEAIVATLPDAMPA